MCQNAGTVSHPVSPKRLFCYYAHHLIDIGFISELMRFEERMLGVKSSGVAGMGSSLPTSSSSTSRSPAIPYSAVSASHSSDSSNDSSPEKPAMTRNNSVPGGSLPVSRLAPAWSRMRDSLPPILPSAEGAETWTAIDREQEVKGSR